MISLVMQSAYVKQDNDGKQTELQNLISVIKEDRSLVAAAVSKPAQVMMDSTGTTCSNALSSECCADRDLTALKKEMKCLQ